MSKRLGQQLKTLRKKNQWSIAEAARRTGYHRSSIQNMEQGKGGVLFTRYMHYAITLGGTIVFEFKDAQDHSESEA